MLVELEVTKTVDGIGFRFEELDSGQLSVVEVFNRSLDLKPGDVLLSISGVGLRGFISVEVDEKFDSIPPETPFSLYVGRKPSSADWEKYSGPTKDDLRKKIWEKLEKENIADFPRPCHYRIPNFKGSKGACDRLLTLPEFVSAKTIKINPDKPQQHARFLTLQQRKKLLVPTPRLKSGLFNHIQPPEAPSTEVLKRCCTAQGVKEFGLPIPLESKMHVDLVIIGSVVVSKSGFRIGKGEGFADMEWAMMASMGAVGPETNIVTVVRDEQIMDIPPFLVDSHDVTVDYILTPTRILQCEANLPRPTGIIWDKLTVERINEMPILRKILDMDKDKGKSIVLKSSSEDVGGGGGSGSSGGRARGGSALKSSAEDWEGGAGGGRGGSSAGRGRGGRGRGARGGGRGNNDLCFSCQSPGHWYRDCPSRDTSDRGGGPGGSSRGLNRTLRGYGGERGGGWRGGWGRGGGPVN